MNQASIFCRIASPENKNNSKMIKSNANELALKMKWLHNNTLQNTAYMSYQGFPSVLPLKWFLVIRFLVKPVPCTQGLVIDMQPHSKRTSITVSFSSREEIN